jgi:hypothetical protein
MSIVAVVAYCVLAPLAVTANAPLIFEGDVVEEDGLVANCGDFQILANGSGTTRTTVFVDGSGNPIRILFQGRYNGSLTNSVTGATLMDSPSVANITLDLADGTQTNVGTFFNITAPGEGGVYFQTGRIVFPLEGGEPIFIAGQQAPPPVFVATVCEALR